MKYIKKIAAPDFFLKDVKEIENWSKFSRKKKKWLKSYILEKEQFYLCCYCEIKIMDLAKSHIEHLKPKSLDVENLTFDYSNLAVSCEGYCFNEEDDKSKNTCGHKKDNDFDENLFLNPTIIENVSDYFVFDADGVISASKLNTKKSNYNIGLLNLNGKNDKIAEARKNTLRALKISLNKQKLTPTQKKEKIKVLLANKDREFGTFLRFRFKNIL